MIRYLILLGLVIGSCHGISCNAQTQEVSERDLKRLERSIGKLRKELTKHRGEQSQLQQQLKQSESAIGQLEGQIAQSQRSRQQLDKQLAQYKRQQSELQAARLKQQTLMAAQLRSAYQMGQQHATKALLNQQDPTRIARVMTYVRYLNLARMAQVDSFNQTLAELANVEGAILADSNRLSATEQTLKLQRSELQQQQQNRTTTLRQLASTIKSKDAQLRQQQKDHDDLEKLLQSVADVTASMASSDSAQPFTSRKGKMSWPAAGKRINRFGSRRSQGGLQWEGIEIQAPEGKPVHAIHSGRVVFADWFRGQGLLIIIDHGDGYISLYGHNHSLLRTTGDWVANGETLATVGSSGGRQNSALYFEIRHKGKPINPSQWCKP